MLTLVFYIKHFTETVLNYLYIVRMHERCKGLFTKQEKIGPKLIITIKIIYTTYILSQEEKQYLHYLFQELELINIYTHQRKNKYIYIFADNIECSQ